MQGKVNVLAGARLMKGQLTPEEVEALGQISFADIRYGQWDEVLRKSAMREIAALVRAPVLVEYDVEYESDDHGGFFPSYNVDLKLAENPAMGRLRLDQDIEYMLDCIDDPVSAGVLVGVLGGDQATVTVDQEGALEHVALTDEARAALDRLYEATIYLASRRVDTSAPIEPAPNSP